MNFEHPSIQIFSFFSVAFPIGVKVLAAIVCGGLIGLERELKNKSAGLKTNILICLGSTLYTIISMLISQVFTDSGQIGDPARIAAQIVPGIGFIGAGAIMQSRLTTAATIWVVAAIGICIGAGYPLVAFVFTVTVLFTLLGIDRFEKKFIGHTGNHALEIVFSDDEGKTRAAINQIMSNCEILLDDFDIMQQDGRHVLRIQYTNSNASHRRLIMDLWGIKGIQEVRQF